MPSSKHIREAAAFRAQLEAGDMVARQNFRSTRQAVPGFKQGNFLRFLPKSCQIMVFISE
jgi:hypothetical protein